MRRVGVTGASGFLGTALVEYLAARPGVRVIGLTRTASAGQQHPSVEWFEGDLASQYDAAAFVADLDCVVHLAHKGSPLTSGRDLPNDAASNLIPTLTLLQAIRERGTPCHLVFASSGGALYAGLAQGTPASETSPIDLTSSYAIQKLATEHYLRLAVDEGWLTATTLRIGNAYGSVLPPDRLQGFLGVAVARLLAGEALRLIGNTRNVRDYVHLTDVCAAFSLALDAHKPFDVFNIGSGQGTSIDELVSLLGEITGTPPEVERVVDAAAARLPRWVVLDAAKAERILGWQPTVPLREGVEELWRTASRWALRS